MKCTMGFSASWNPSSRREPSLCLQTGGSEGKTALNDGDTVGCAHEIGQ